MISFRNQWAWLCSASLMCGAVAFSEEPGASTSLGSSQEPARLQTSAAAETPDPTDYFQRLERAEAHIAELQTQNQTLRESIRRPESEIQQTGYGPLHMAPLFFAHDPEIGIVREQTSSTSALLDAPKDPSKPAEAPKPKKWYDKLSIRGYAQFRLNEETFHEAGSAPLQYVGDRSLADNQSFLIRRARVIISGDVHERLYVYLQPDFASSPGSSADPNNQFVQIRDWYGDFYFDDEKELRMRVGQSKVPYGWENLQSSSNRLPLDRADALNSAVRNERDLGVYLFYTPTWAQDFFKDVLEKGLKGSGNYGLLSAGVYNGQGGSLNEINDTLHTFARLTLPLKLDNGQHMEVGIQGYTGQYAVIGSTIDPDGAGAVAPLTPDGTVSASGVGAGGNALADRRGHTDKRLASTFVWYPQPFGFQTEWTVGEGPGLIVDGATTRVDRMPLYGGYAMALYKYDTDCWGTFFPFARYSYFKGGYKSERNAPVVNIDEWEIGTEWQINPAAELTMSYLITDRTNTTANSAAGSTSYSQYDGEAIRLQFQINY